jgi:hypothetical protein
MLFQLAPTSSSAPDDKERVTVPYRVVAGPMRFFITFGELQAQDYAGPTGGGGHRSASPEFLSRARDLL